jgi:hypothetical protein
MRRDDSAGCPTLLQKHRAARVELLLEPVFLIAKKHIPNELWLSLNVGVIKNIRGDLENYSSFVRADRASDAIMIVLRAPDRTAARIFPAPFLRLSCGDAC